MRRPAVIMMLPVLWAAAANAAAQPGQRLVLSELLFHPRAGEAEYVELYNSGTTAEELSDYEVVRSVGDTLGKRYALPQRTLAPGEHVVLTKDASSVVRNYRVERAERVVECDLPPYPDGGGSVLLARKGGEVVERLDYGPHMHSPLLRNKAGVAIERRDYGRPCNEAGNWFSASSTSGYGTPGSPNSQSREWLVRETDFDCSPTLLSPDGDGYQDATTIAYRVDDDGLMGSMAIYDARGRRVRRLLNNGLLGTHGEVVWDGRDDGGRYLPTGRYVLHIIVYDQHGTRQTLKRVLSIVGR